MAGDYHITDRDFYSSEGNIIIEVHLIIENEDMEYMHNNGIAGKYRNFQLWKKNFLLKYPSFCEREDGSANCHLNMYIGAMVLFIIEMV